EFPPLWSRLTESALAAIPTLIIGGTQTVSLAGEEPQSAEVLGAELRKLEGIHQERDDYISTLDRNHEIRHVRFSVPSVIEFAKRCHGGEAERSNISDPAHGTRGLQPRRSRRVRCRASPRENSFSDHHITKLDSSKCVIGQMWAKFFRVADFSHSLAHGWATRSS